MKHIQSYQCNNGRLTPSVLIALFGKGIREEEELGLVHMGLGE